MMIYFQILFFIKFFNIHTFIMGWPVLLLLSWYSSNQEQKKKIVSLIYTGNHFTYKGVIFCSVILEIGL